MTDATTSESGAASSSALRAELMELIHGCPVDLCNPETCPLFQLRQLNYQQRIEWFNSLTPEDLEYMAAYHYVCMKLKLAAHSGELAQVV